MYRSGGVQDPANQLQQRFFATLVYGLNYFRKKATSTMFEGVLQTHLVLKQPFNLEMMTQLQLL